VVERIEGQLARKSELEGMNAGVDALSTHVKDLHELVRSLKEDKALPEMEARAKTLASRLEGFQQKLDELEQIEKIMQDRERRAVEISARLEALSSRIEQQGERVTVVTRELAALDEGRREWLQEVHRVTDLQKGLQEQASAAARKVEELQTLAAAVEEKRAKLVASESRITQHETRIDRLGALLSGIEGKIDDLETRQRSVVQVKEQVDSLFESTERTRNDAMAVLGARQEILDTRGKIEQLLREATALTAKYDGLDRRRESIDQAQSKMENLTNVIADVEANLENLKEQRTVVEHVAEKLARLDFALQRAEAATRELREERALASRIYKSLQEQKAATPDPGAGKPPSKRH
jgi:chromosome segregation ATPase